MDPNENIKRQRELAQEILTLNQSGSTDAPDDDTVDRLIGSAAELAELVASGLPDELRVEIREALSGDSNDAEHDALVSVADHFGVHYSGESPDPDWMNP